MSSEAEIASSVLEPTPAARGPILSQKLGEELPIFCERCGYSLNGLPQGRCADCKILHFHCPECGHRQPINTLRPAAQRVLGRLRALWLCFSVFFKLNFFGWLLFAWVAMGVEWSYEWEWYGNRAVTITTPGGGTQQRIVPQNRIKPRAIDLEALAAFGCFGLAFGLFGRMLLLRWRRGYIIGIVLALLVIGAVCLGARIRHFEMSDRGTTNVSPFTVEMFSLMLVGALLIVIGAWISWPIWMLLVKLFLPSRTGTALLEWQKTLSGPVGKLAQE